MPSISDPVQDHLPLTHLSYHVLVALGDGPLHGYGMLKEMESESGGALSPSTGSLYLALQRMEDEGLIEESPDRPDEDDDARRRYYRLTDLGRAVARAETARLDSLVGAAVRAGLAPEEPGSESAAAAGGP